MTKQPVINYVSGDVTVPNGDGQKFIVHCCNNLGIMGAGVALALANRWPLVKTNYVEWYKNGTWHNQKWELGNYQLVVVDKQKEVIVVNLLGQEGVGFQDGIPIRYVAIEKGFRRLCDNINYGGFPNPSIHMPRIGCGLAGGKWEEIEPIILRTFCSAGIFVTVYDFN